MFFLKLGNFIIWSYQVSCLSHNVNINIFGIFMCLTQLQTSFYNIYGWLSCNNSFPIGHDIHIKDPYRITSIHIKDTYWMTSIHIKDTYRITSIHIKDTYWMTTIHIILRHIQNTCIHMKGQTRIPNFTKQIKLLEWICFLLAK